MVLTCIFLMNINVKHVLTGRLYVFGEILVQVFCLFFNWVVCLSVEFVAVLYRFWILEASVDLDLCTGSSLCVCQGPELLAGILTPLTFCAPWTCAFPVELERPHLYRGGDIWLEAGEGYSQA